MKMKKKKSIGETVEFICGLIGIAIVLWFVASWLNVIATNLPDNSAVPAAWNLFEIIF